MGERPSILKCGKASGKHQEQAEGFFNVFPLRRRRKSIRTKLKRLNCDGGEKFDDVRNKRTHYDVILW